MTEQDPEHSHAPQEPGVIPRWVPVLVGVVLVAMAGLAVFTGLRGRDQDTLLEHVRPRRQQQGASTPAPPGEPGAGASLVLHGQSGETTPTANEPVQGQSRAVISGGPRGVTSAVRIWARRGMMLRVVPEDTMVYVNDLPIGQARQFDTTEEVYEFAAPGSYTVKLVAANGAERMFVVTASEDAKDDVARVDADLRRR
jgi:hypothetical protein